MRRGGAATERADRGAWSQSPAVRTFYEDFVVGKWNPGKAQFELQGNVESFDGKTWR